MMWGPTVYLLVYCLIPSFTYGNLPPQFISDLSPPIIKENTRVGSSILTLVATDPEGLPLKYALQGTSVVKVNEQSGVITLVQPLDREKIDTIRMTVTVEDQVEGAANNIVRVPLEIVIIDVNDNTPLFSQTAFKIEIPEDTPVGTTLQLQIRVSDQDQVGDVIKVSCSESADSHEPCEYFAVRAQRETARLFQGVLVLTKSLSYASNPLTQVSLVAFDGVHTVAAWLTVTVRDVQDTAPIFQGSTTAIIAEDVPIGTLVTIVKAYDGDLGVPRKIMYKLVEDSQGNFIMDSQTGELRTARPLDREHSPDPSAPISLTVKAYETENDVRVIGLKTESQIELSITIRDVNDEAPTFNQHEYRISLPENLPSGTPVSDLNMIVQDLDSGRNSVFSVRLKDSSRRFVIEPSVATGSSSLSLRTVRDSFDYENPNERSFILLAIAEESLTAPRLSSTATIYVSITDRNDNTPTFVQEAYTAVVQETATVGTVVLQITAMDRDSGNLGLQGIRYSIFGNGAERFVTDPTTGVISVAACDNPGDKGCLDFETRQTYFLSFQATDDLGKGHTTTVPVRISIKDNNDNPPKFTRPTYRAIVRENAVDFDPPLVVKATDADATSTLEYSLTDQASSNVFQINERTGRISVRPELEFPFATFGQNEVTLTVEASDGLTTDSAKVRISVRDVNNNAPKFMKQQHVASVVESSPIGTIIEQVSATDADRGKNAIIHYRILKGAYGDFEIDQQTGVVRVARQLDYDQRQQYSMEIIASDRGVPPLTASSFLTVAIIDSNDKSPYFSPSTQRVQVDEGTAKGTVIYTLVAKDLDALTDGSLEFSFQDVSYATKKDGRMLNEIELMPLKSLLEISPTGDVVLRGDLNRNETAEVAFNLQVTDTTSPDLQVGHGILIVTVVHVNKHRPFFAAPWREDYPFISVTLPEEVPLGSVVTEMTAFDIDSNIAGYSLTSSESFRIVEATGHVTVKRRLDYEKEEVVNATIVVRDTGRPQLSATATLIIRLENVNDETPVFEQAYYEGKIDEHSPPGSLVMSVKASDKDKGSLGTITYLLMGAHVQYFTIDSNGKIFVAPEVSINREEISEFHLSAVAEDSGPENTRRRTTVPVHITVLDINDHHPKFIKPLFSAVITDHLMVTHPVPLLQVEAVDEDASDSHLTYTITSSSEDTSKFELDSKSGILYVVSAIDVIEKEIINFNVEVRDANNTGTVPGKAQVTITILPQNQNKPIFVSPPHADFVVGISENALPQSEVITLKATDQDDGSNGVVRYHLRQGDSNVQETSTFQLHPASGLLTTKHSLDREHVPNYQLVLVAKDNGSPNAYETLIIMNIEVQDMDDNRPTFSSQAGHRNYKFELSENSPKDTLVGNVEAVDLDVGENGRIFYYIVSGNLNTNFYVDKSNGNIFSGDSLDREEIASYTLLMLASNDANEDLNQYADTQHIEPNGSFTYVQIEIHDQNDTPPRFHKKVFYAGVSPTAELETMVTEVKALDEDDGPNGTVSYSIRTSTFFLPGQEKAIGSIVPSPFNITKDGNIVTASSMQQYKRHRFLLDVMAKEIASPFRSVQCQVNIWVWGKNELIKVVLEERPEVVALQQEVISDALSRAFKGITVIDEIRYLTHANNSVDRDWTELLIHVVNETSSIIPPEEVLFKADRAYAQLSEQAESSKIRKIYPVVTPLNNGVFDTRIAGLAALLAALGLGFVTFVVVYCCLRFWVMSPATSKEQLIHRTRDDDLGVNTTENPLWLDQKLKRYEEQELSMHVSGEVEGLGHQRQTSNNNPRVPNDDAQSNTYATIQKSLGGTIRARHLKNLIRQDEFVLSLGHDLGESNDYATLDHLQLDEHRQHMDATREFTGSTFQPLDVGNMVNRPLPEEPANGNGIAPMLITGQSNEPCLVAELI